MTHHTHQTTVQPRNRLVWRQDRLKWRPDSKILRGEFDGDKTLADVRTWIDETRMESVVEATAKEDGSCDYAIYECLHPAGCQCRQNSGPFETAIDYFFTTRTLDYH